MIVRASALKHGLAEDDIVVAARVPVRTITLDDGPMLSAQITRATK